MIQIVTMCIPTQQIEVEPITTTTTNSTTTTTTTTSTTTTKPPPACPDSTWTLFDRGNCSWCMKINRDSVFNDITSMNAACATLDPSAVASGFQNVAEIAKMTVVTLSEVPGQYQIAVGAFRRPECDDLNYLTATCSAQNSFYGTDGFAWVGGVPNNTYPTYICRNVLVDTLYKQAILAVFGIGPKNVFCGMLAK